VVITTLADGITRGIEAVSDTVTAPFSDPVIRLGVTGLSRAGKTVFITSLVANLLDRGRMPQFRAAASGAIQTAYLQPQPDDTVARFAFEDHLAALSANKPHWPHGTQRTSELRLSLKVQPTGLLGSFQGPRTVHVDIVDYPGEWLLDLSLLDLDFAAWSAHVLSRIDARPKAQDFTDVLAATDCAALFAEPHAQALASAFTAHLNAAREAIHAGPQAVEDMRRAMADILGAFRPGRNAFLSRLFQGRRIDKILFAATKADHLHHEQHPQLTAITQALLRDAKDRAEFSGATTQAMSIAALRTTVEETRTHNGATLGVVRGQVLGSDGRAAFYPGALPDDPAHFLGPARSGAQEWLDADFEVMKFAPAPLTLKPGDGPPHIRLDKAAQFLLGDKL